MSRMHLILTVATLLGCVGIQFAHSENEKPVAVSSSGGVGCDAASKSPEVYSVYGDANTVLAKLNNFNLDLPDRRMFVVFVESAEKAEMQVFERVGEKSMSVSSWNGKDVAELKSQLDKAIVRNKGVNCIGEQTKSLFAKSLGEQLKKKNEKAAAPETPSAAVRHLLPSAGDFVGVTFYLLC